MIVTIQHNQIEVRKSLDHATLTLKEVDIPPKKTRRMQAVRLLALGHGKITMLTKHRHQHNASSNKCQVLVFIPQLLKANSEVSRLLNRLIINHGKLASNIVAKMEVS